MKFYREHIEGSFTENTWSEVLQRTHRGKFYGEHME